MKETIIAIDGLIRGKPFYAGIVARDGRVIEAAHVVKYMKGWTGQQVADHCKKLGWTWERVVTMDSSNS